jgi:mannose/fructose/N-acetylgalactosamine-specific phosphotransferase system component IIC
VSLLSFLRNFAPGLEDKTAIPIAMLLLLVCSAAITGFLVFGKPVMLYIDGNKKEAISLLGYTLGILVIITIIAFVFLVTYYK